MKSSEKEINLTKIYNQNTVADNFGVESSFNRTKTSSKYVGKFLAKTIFSWVMLV